MTTFDFSSYRNCPRGWRILRADSELWLDHIASDRVYMIRSPIRGEFELYYTSIVTKDPEFVMRTDSMFVCLQRCGLLMPQPSQTKQTRLTIKKHYS
jgi:hypothetical protein